MFFLHYGYVKVFIINIRLQDNILFCNVSYIKQYDSLCQYSIGHTISNKIYNISHSIQYNMITLQYIVRYAYYILMKTVMLSNLW